MYDLSPENYFYLIGGGILLFVVLLDTDWKRKLLKRFGEKNL